MLKKLEEYAELALKIGVNIQEGQKLFIKYPYTCSGICKDDN